jgi:hypothetical protein
MRLGVNYPLARDFDLDSDIRLISRALSVISSFNFSVDVTCSFSTRRIDEKVNIAATAVVKQPIVGETLISTYKPHILIGGS